MTSNGSKWNVFGPHVFLRILAKMKKSNFGISSLTRPKMKVDQISKIRPFFQSAHWADSKNAKIFEKSSFFEKICLRKPARVHQPSDFFSSKSCNWSIYDWVQVSEKLFDSFQNWKFGLRPQKKAMCQFVLRCSKVRPIWNQFFCQNWHILT